MRQVVPFARLWAGPDPVAVVAQGNSRLPNPPGPSSRSTNDQREVRHVTGDDGAGGNHGPPSDRDAGDHDRAGTQSSSLAHRHPRGDPVILRLELTVGSGRTR